MTKTLALRHPSYSPESSPFLNEIRQPGYASQAHEPWTEALYLHYVLNVHPALSQAALLSTNPRQRIADEHVYHQSAAEAGVHQDHPGGVLADLADDGRFFSALDNADVPRSSWLLTRW